jgi:inorganic pyrophosphatase
MGNIVELFNDRERRITFYEVSDSQDIAIWGGEDPIEALKWYRNSPKGSKVKVSEWLTTEEDAKPILEGVEITPLVLATIADCIERWSK